MSKSNIFNDRSRKALLEDIIDIDDFDSEEEFDAEARRKELFKKARNLYLITPDEGTTEEAAKRTFTLEKEEVEELMSELEATGQLPQRDLARLRNIIDRGVGSWNQKWRFSRKAQEGAVANVGKMTEEFLNARAQPFGGIVDYILDKEKTPPPPLDSYKEMVPLLGVKTWTDWLKRATATAKANSGKSHIPSRFSGLTAQEFMFAFIYRDEAFKELSADQFAAVKPKDRGVYKEVRDLIEKAPPNIVELGLEGLHALQADYEKLAGKAHYKNELGFNKYTASQYEKYLAGELDKDPKVIFDSHPLQLWQLFYYDRKKMDFIPRIIEEARRASLRGGTEEAGYTDSATIDTLTRVFLVLFPEAREELRGKMINPKPGASMVHTEYVVPDKFKKGGKGGKERYISQDSKGILRAVDGNIKIAIPEDVRGATGRGGGPVPVTDSLFSRQDFLYSGKMIRTIFES